MTAALKRTAALLEVLGVTAAGPLLTSLIARRLSIPNPLETLRVDTTGPDLLVGAGWMFLILMIQYAGWFLLVVPLGWWRRRQGPADYGLTRAGIAWPRLGLIAIAAAALCAWPILAFTLAHPNPGDQTTPWRQALFTMPLTWQYFVFTAVASWALVPVLEETFFRGYVLRRLEEDWGSGPAIVGSACLFTFSHSQYLVLNGYNIGILAAIIVFALALGVSFVVTRSIIPGVAAHVLINFPIRGPWLQGLVLAAAILIALFLARRAIGWTQLALRGTAARALAALAGAAIAFDLIWARDQLWISGALSALFVLAVALEVWDQRAPNNPKFA